MWVHILLNNLASSPLQQKYYFWQRSQNAVKKQWKVILRYLSLQFSCDKIIKKTSFIKRQTSDTSSDNEWYNEWQRMITSGTTSDNEWNRVATNKDEWYNEWQRMITSGTTSGKMSDNEWNRVATNKDEWYNEWQRVVQRDNEWQQMTTSDKEWQRVTINKNEWQ